MSESLSLVYVGEDEITGNASRSSPPYLDLEPCLLCYSLDLGHRLPDRFTVRVLLDDRDDDGLYEVRSCMGKDEAHLGGEGRSDSTHRDIMQR